MNKRKKLLLCIAVIFGIALGIYIKLCYSPIKIRTSEYNARLYPDGVHLIAYIGKVEDVVIPNYIGIFPVTVISQDCFYSNDFVKTVIIPDNVKSIGMHAFEQCHQLKSVKGKNVRKIEQDAFACDWKLETVELGDKLQVIEDGAFWRCNALTYIPSKESLKEIGDYAFEACEIENHGDLTGITVGDNAFNDCPFSKYH